jgi:hypothetical protein
MRRSLVVSFLWVMSVLSLFAQKQVYMFTSFHEPATEGLRFLYSYDGYHWTDLGRTFLKPNSGKVMRDPSLIQGPDGTFHLVWTSAWRGDLGFGYASSNDLIHWSEKEFLPLMAYDTTTVNVWAPELFYDDETKKFIIVWASTIPYKFPKGIEEENNNQRLYYSITSDFKEFSPGKLFMDPGFSVIDATIVKQAKNKYVLVLKDNTRPNRNLKVAFSDKALGPYTNVSEPFTRGFCEGPSVVKVGKDWLIYYDAYRDKKYGASKTRDFKTFTEVWDRVSLPEGHKHGTIFRVNEDVFNKLKNDQNEK